jgi:FtsH-binding integral membrane protein
MNYSQEPRGGRAQPQAWGYGGASAQTANDALWKTYRWMSAGLGITGLVAMAVASSPAATSLILGNRLVFYVLLFAQLGFVWTFNAVAARTSTVGAAAMFFLYSALTGATLSSIFFVYTMSSIASVFFISAGAFAGLSAVGLFVKRDLGVVGRFAIFALIGLFIAMIVNMFVASAGLNLAICAIGVLIFAALTAYDTQKLKEMFQSGGVQGNLPLVGALVLYLDFINLFLFLLRLFGRRRD